MSKKQRTLLVGFVTLVLLAVMAWLFRCALAEGPVAGVSVTLLGYTNDVAGIPMFGYAASNVAASGFAVFSAHNSTRGYFACFLNCVIVSHADTGKGGVIPLKGALYSSQTNKAPPNGGGDFQLAPGARVTFAVPVPDVHGTWQCLLNLIHVRYYKHDWQVEAIVLAQRLGLAHWSEKGQTVASREIAQ